MQQQSIIGRVKEQTILKEALHSNEAEMVAVIGRRRVGKTFLIRSVYKNELTFEIAGMQNASRKEQLRNFALRLNRMAKPAKKISTPSSWLEAIYLLIDFLESVQNGQKQVVFFDELPWLATRKSGFLRALGVFWNSWASINNVVVVICGSAASWMIQKVVNNRGGLHNRITKRLHLSPFSLSETEEYLRNRQVFLDRYQMTLLYMAMGGIPHYLKEIKTGKSATQNIEEICFSETGLLRDEFSRLYPALFEDSDNHIAIIRILAGRQKGIPRKEILASGKFSSGGALTKALMELEHSGFISFYFPFNKKKKEKLYRLTDEYSYFYLQFIEDKIHEENDVWQSLSQTQQYKTWTGYSFENLCLKHIPLIKKALGISGVYSLSSTYLQKGNSDKKGVQIDLLIDRNDHVINLCEVKFYASEFSIDAAFAQNLRERRGAFLAGTKTKKQLFWTLITTFGIHQNQHSLGLVNQVLTLDDLFA